MSKPVAIIIPAYNRCAITKRCLETLFEQGVGDWAIPLIVDDGSTDGTAEMLQSFGDRIVVVKGTGNLWWGGAVLKGMQTAVERNFRFMFFLNDDCEPLPGTLRSMVDYAEKHECITVGVAETPTGYCYGGHRKRWNGLELVAPGRGAEVATCDTFGGNCVCFPRWAVRKGGFPDAGTFPHQLCDTDYGLRLSRQGIPVRISGEWRCRNDDNFGEENKSWVHDASLKEVFTGFFSMRSITYIPARFHFFMRHWKLLGFVLFLIPYLKFIVIATLRLLVPRRFISQHVAKDSVRHRRFATAENTAKQGCNNRFSDNGNA